MRGELNRCRSDLAGCRDVDAIESKPHDLLRIIQNHFQITTSSIDRPVCALFGVVVGIRNRNPRFEFGWTRWFQADSQLRKSLDTRSRNPRGLRTRHGCRVILERCVVASNRDVEAG